MPKSKLPTRELEQLLILFLCFTREIKRISYGIKFHIVFHIEYEIVLKKTITSLGNDYIIQTLQVQYILYFRWFLRDFFKKESKTNDFMATHLK